MTVFVALLTFLIVKAHRWLGTLVLLQIACVVRSPGDIIEHWTKRLSISPKVRFFAGASNRGGLFIAVGGGGTILTSSNGVAWTAQNSGTTRHLTGVAFGFYSGQGERFVVVGDETILISSDTRNWTNVTGATGCYLQDIAGAFNRFVAVGFSHFGRGGANILYYPKLVIHPERPTEFVPEWGRVAITNRSPFGDNAYFTAIVAGTASVSSRWVAVGDIWTGIWTATFLGDDWTYRGPDSPPYLYFEGIAHAGDGRMVAIGVEGPPLVSTDNGITWTNSRTSMWGPEAHDITFADGRFVAASRDRSIVTSSNGMDWELHEGTPRGHAIAYGAGTFVLSTLWPEPGIYQSDSIAGRLSSRRLHNAGPVELSLLIDPGRTFGVETSTNLLHWNLLWRSTNHGSISSTQFVDWSSTNHPRRYYRSLTP